MSQRVVYRYDPVALAGANLGIDVEASGERFAATLRGALEREFPAATIEVVRGRSGVELEGFDDPPTATLRVEGLARAVRTATDWIVYR